MSIPRILARPWRPLYTPSHPPRPGAPRGWPSSRPSSTSTSTTWGRGAGVAPRPERATQTAEVAPRIENPGPRIQKGPSWVEGKSPRAKNRAPRVEEPNHPRDKPSWAKETPSWVPHVPTSGVEKPPSRIKEPAPKTEDTSVGGNEIGAWDREAAKALIESHGPAFVLSRFEALAERQCRIDGSAGTLGEALREMRALGLTPTPAFYGTALAALAIHPDCLLRSTILDMMRKDWVKSTPEHRIHTALGLLRDGQYEMTLDELDDMHRDGVPVPPYLHEIFIFALARLGFFDEALASLRYRTAQDPPVAQDVLHFLLDTCSAAYHYTTTKHLWRSVTEDPAAAAPSDGILVNVLNTAARHADPSLALEALRHLTDRRVQLSFHHFEPVVEAYAGAGDPEGALRILCVMDSAGIRPGRDATRSLSSFLLSNPSRIPSCIAALEELGQNYKVPIAAPNAILEALVRSGDVPAAEALLARIETLTPNPPTVATFLPFLLAPDPPISACVSASRFRTLSLPAPDLARLAAHLAPHSLDAALRYLRRLDAAHRGPPDAWVAYPDAVRAVAVGLMRGRDERTWEFLAEMGRRNEPLAADVREMGRAGEIE
ncbi:uncharacterized protein DNG_02532 [Cephalotrichum gorgonifer]|uniref:Pentatricopeptide repeat-containing protein-mitochondrial domain-containing protein n=1 Tax=Cephalotrichum gorgonifer TaxID=2041049 RepID=A0AAE8ST60_9PEZI|nr:uncharacterized protein DNG_02532 [Cephalotrichum gorgonifer]